MTPALEKTAALSLPLIMPSQAQKHVTHNEALGMLDMLVQATVQDRNLQAPPETPQAGECHIVAKDAIGAWAGRDNQLAAFSGTDWTYLAPLAGWRCYVVDEAQMCVFDGSEWQILFDRSSLQNLSLLGIGTEADATNPFAAKLDSALWTARYDDDGGTGDLRYTLNKQATGNTLSLLFQTNYSGRAELGLTGNDSFSFKVSADGTDWRVPLTVDTTNGYLGLGTEQPLTPLHLHVGGGALPAAALITSDDVMISKNDDAAGFSGTVAGSDSGSRMVFKGTRVRGTVDTPETVEDGDEVISLLGAIYDGSKVLATGQISLTADGSSSDGSAPQRVSFWTGVDARREQMRVDSTGQAYFQGIATTASGANAVLAAGSNPANALLRSTSSLAYKKDVEPVDPNYSRALMALEPIWYRSKAKADDPAHSFWGFAAEEVAAVDPRLVSWGYRDDDYDWIDAEDGERGVRRERQLKSGARKKPDGVAYDRFVVHHHMLIKMLMARLQRLEAVMQSLDADCA